MSRECSNRKLQLSIVLLLLSSSCFAGQEGWERDKRSLLTNFNNMYHSFSDPPGYPIAPGQSRWKSRQLREAISHDGMSWKKLDYIEPDIDTDACHVPQALVTKIDGKEWLYLFYATQIGYKKNDGKYHFKYDRIRAMRRAIVALHR